MKTDRLGTILFLVVMFSVASSLPGYALEPPPTLEYALAGAVPIVFSPQPFDQGYPQSGGQVTTTKFYIFPGSLERFSPNQLNLAPFLGFRGVITRMTVFQSQLLYRKYTLYVNGKPTQLTCSAYDFGCSANWNVPIDVRDQVCVEFLGAGGMNRPTITLMVRMGEK